MLEVLNKEKEDLFVSLSKDTTFKYLFKKENTRKWLEEIILDQTGIDLKGYKLIDGEINSGNQIKKDYRLDLLFEKDNDLVIVEMNTRNSISNLFKNYSYLFQVAGSRYNKDEKIYTRKSTKLIIINSFTLKEVMGIPVLFFVLQDKDNQVKRDMIESYEIYLPKANQKEYNRIEKKLLLFRAKSFEEMRKITQEEDDLKIIEELERLSMDDYFRYMYNGKEVDERLHNSHIEEAKEEAREEALAEGQSIGANKEKIEIAKSMLKNKLDIQVISECTGLTIKDIKELETK